MNPVHGHSGTTVPPDADMKAAKEGQAQVCWAMPQRLRAVEVSRSFALC